MIDKLQYVAKTRIFLLDLKRVDNSYNTQKPVWFR